MTNAQTELGVRVVRRVYYWWDIVVRHGVLMVTMSTMARARDVCILVQHATSCSV